MSTASPMGVPSLQPPHVSKTTIPVAGLLVDVYGLDQLPTAATAVSCLWLHHGRLGNKNDMATFAALVLSAWHARTNDNNSSTGSSSASRGLIAVAFDERNHGTRLAHKASNDAWRDGNKTHAQDMFGVVTGGVVDMAHLMDALEGYLFGNGASSPGSLQAATLGSRRQAGLTDQHLALGVSQGGHTVWQAMFAEPRLSAGVVVIGCPDYMAIMTDRARLTRLPTYSAADHGASFLGSEDFPHALVEACKKYDPKGILFGTREISASPSDVEKERLGSILDTRLAKKKFQVLSGGVDKLVPYALAKPFLDFFKSAVETWGKQANISVEDIVYPGVGHKFDDAMMKDAVRFIVDIVSGADATQASTAKI
ncbi:uncharacterized protein PG986_007514 [Apiospora aurea]|uniref:Uncharacterized protein n=1 Tax=Apiospora aurea TaxID=335848 RepID=A0ABR1QCS8_9PEZI